MRGVCKVGPSTQRWPPLGPTLSTHQRVITSAIFEETGGRILI